MTPPLLKNDPSPALHRDIPAHFINMFPDPTPSLTNIIDLTGPIPGHGNNNIILTWGSLTAIIFIDASTIYMASFGGVYLNHGLLSLVFIIQTRALNTNTIVLLIKFVA